MDELEAYNALDAYFEMCTLLDGTAANNLKFQNKLVALFKSIEEKAYSKGFDAGIAINIDKTINQ
jgi:hypothetical protein